jgi:histidinol-phosphatase (PHP family)
MKARANYHTHTTWCDGKDAPETFVLSAIDKGFEAIGFSSHAMMPDALLDWVLTDAKAPLYVAEIRALQAKYAGMIRVFCGVEADYAVGFSNPDRSVYAAMGPDYIIGSVHFVAAPDGAQVCVDDTPDILADGIRDHFGGSVETYLRAYFRQVREMVEKFDFDMVGHLDLVRKFNLKHPYFDERAAWYREELVMTADAVARSGKIVEVNTGAISRGWLDDAYPSAEFRKLLRERGAKFILSADAHAADAIDCAFDRFENAEEYVRFL